LAGAFTFFVGVFLAAVFLTVAFEGATFLATAFLGLLLLGAAFLVVLFLTVVFLVAIFAPPADKKCGTVVCKHITTPYTDKSFRSFLEKLAPKILTAF
jgi:hypothetical protein